MKTVLAPIACTLALALGTTFTASADDGPTNCSLATLRGTYAFAFTETRQGAPFSSSGMESYDGLGHLKYRQLWSTGYTSGQWTGTGTYSFAKATNNGITASCVATVIYDGDTTHPWRYFVAPNGSAFFWNNILNTGDVSGGRESRISTATLVN